MAAGRMQAPLETRGPGVLGKWEEQYFCLENCVLESFAMDGKSTDQPLRRIPVQGITGLTMEPGTRECSFLSDGLKVRLRARSEEEMHEWFVALHAAQALPHSEVQRGGQDVQEPEEQPQAVVHPGAKDVRDLDDQAGDQAEASDVLVHVAGIFGLPRPTAAGVESKWYAVLRWRKTTSRFWVKEKAAVPTPNQHTDECHLKQTIRLQSVPSTRTLLVDVYRVGTGVGGSQRYGECTINVDDGNNHKMKDHPVTLTSGKTGAIMRMRLRYTSEEEPPLSSGCVGGASSAAEPYSAGIASSLKDPPRGAGLLGSSTPRGASRGDAKMPKDLPPAAGYLGAPSPGAASSRSGVASVHKDPHPGDGLLGASSPGAASPHKSDGSGPDTPPRSASARRNRALSPASASEAEEAVRLALPDSLMLTPSSGGGTSSSSPASKTAKPNKGRVKTDKLYGDHASKQKKLEDKRAAREQEAMKQIQESREATMKKGRKHWTPGDLDPRKAADRLFEDHKARSRELAELQQRYEEEERQQLEERRFHKRGMVRSESAPSHVVAKEVGERLHKDQERREQEAQRRKEAREAHVLQELEKSSSGPYRRCLTARGETKRHEELYEYAAIQREVLDRKRRERQEAEMRKQTEAMVGARRGPFNGKRIDELFRDHQEREQKKAFKKAEQQTKELQQIESDTKRLLRRKPSPRGGAPRAEQVTVSLELLSLDCGLLLTDQALLEQFQAAISGAIVEEAGHDITPESVEIDFREGSDSESSVVVQATITTLNCNIASGVHALLSSATSLGASVVGRLASLDYVGTVSQGVISVSDRGVTVGRALQQDRQRTLPIWQRSVGQSRKDEPQEPPPAPPAAVSDPATQADIVLNAVVSTINLRCFFDRTSTAAELKWIGTPLKSAMSVLKDAVTACEKGDGFLRLSSASSQRIFFDGQLLPEDEGIRACIEPSPIRQVEENLNTLMMIAAEAQVQLGEMLAPSPTPGAVWEPGTSRSKPAGVPQAVLAYNPGPKPRDVAELKAWVRYQASDRGRAPRHLLDLARFGLVFANSSMLQKGLDAIVKKFEVLSVRNFYNTPGRLGHRLVEVHLCLEVERGETKVPHVCELRLEELACEAARVEAEAHLDQFFQRLGSVYNNSSRETDAIAYLAHSLLVDPPEHRSLRIFRCRLAKNFGSAITGWRRNFAATRQLHFGRFRDVCHAMNCRKEAPELWSRMDPGMSGSISLFEIDPDAVTLLAHIRSRITAIANTADEPGSEDLFRRLSFQLIPAKPGQLDIAEFRQVLRNFGFGIEVADRAFVSLDYQGGSCKPPASVSSTDIAWLQRLPQLVDIDAVMLNSKAQLNDVDNLRYLVSHKAAAASLPSSGTSQGSERRARSEGASRERTRHGRPLSAATARALKQGPKATPPRAGAAARGLGHEEDGEEWDIYHGRTPDREFLEECF